MGLALACCVLTTAGCGGSGGSERLTKDEYLQEVRSVGDDFDAALGELENADIDFTSSEAVADLTDTIGDSLEEIDARAAALDPPEEIQGAHGDFVMGIQELAVWFHALADRIRTEPASALEKLLEQELGAASPTTVEPLRKIYDARRELRAKGYELDEANEGYAIEGPGDPDAGNAVFESAGCSACHTLAAAGSAGRIGPDLDSSFPPYGKVVERVTNGQGIMPSFESQLTEQQIQDVAAYVSSVAST